MKVFDLNRRVDYRYGRPVAAFGFWKRELAGKRINAALERWASARLGNRAAARRKSRMSPIRKFAEHQFPSAMDKHR